MATLADNNGLSDHKHPTPITELNGTRTTQQKAANYNP
jgi:hypothetical protein